MCLLWKVAKFQPLAVPSMTWCSAWGKISSRNPGSSVENVFCVFAPHPQLFRCLFCVSRENRECGVSWNWLGRVIVLRAPWQCSLWTGWTWWERGKVRKWLIPVVAKTTSSEKREGTAETIRPALALPLSQVNCQFIVKCQMWNVKRRTNRIDRNLVVILRRNVQRENCKFCP